MSETSANREAGRPLWKATALVLAMPALIACVDLLVRLQIAAVLQLNHDAAAQGAALRSSLLGVLKDLLLVMPAYGVLALVPCTATRRLTGIAIALAALILAADLAYFYFTLEHVEPVLFVNLNLLALAGTIELRSAASAGLAAIGTLALLRLNTRLVREIRADLARPALAILALGACAFPLLPLAISTQPQMAHQDNEVEQFLDATRNASLRKLSAPILANFFAAAAAARQFEQAAAPIQSVPYTAQEAALLRDLRLLDADAPGEPVAAPAPPEIRRIVIVIVESLAAAFLHSENPAIPAEATPFLDSLVGRYPHFDRFFTSNMPSDWGLNSLLLSRLRPDWDGGRPSLLSVLRDQAGFESFFVRAVSKQYGNELYTYPRMFQMDHYIAHEELSERYVSNWHSSWGFNDAVVFEEGVRILNEHRDDKVVVILNTIDLHQPGPFQGIPYAHLPEELKRRNVGLYNALYWVDVCIRGLFETLEQEGLFDEHTVILLTADHSPNPGVEYRRAVPPEEYLRLGRLPLIVAMRDRERLARLDTAGFASQVDLAPTVLAMVGLPKPRGFVGRSMFGAAANRPALGVYRDTFYYRSDASAFEEQYAGDGLEPTVRRVALRKWLRNLDVDLPTPEPARAHAAR